MYSVCSNPSTKSLSNHQSWKEISLFFYIFMVVSNPSDRHRGLAFRLIYPKFKKNARFLLKLHDCSAVCLCGARHNQQIRNVMEFSLLVRNPSVASTISMASQWASCQMVVTRVPWCMPGSFNPWCPLKRESFPAFPVHLQPAILRILCEAHERRTLSSGWSWEICVVEFPSDIDITLQSTVSEYHSI